MDKIISRVVKFKGKAKGNFDLHHTKDKEVTDCIMLTCIDKRIVPNDLLKVPIGKMFVVRNPGNFVPTCNFHIEKEISSEGGALELAVKLNAIREIIICGHSDCKGMEYLMKMNDEGTVESNATGPLSHWVRKYGVDSWEKFRQFKTDRTQALYFQLLPPPENKSRAFISSHLNLHDSLSQINCLQQAENIALFPFLHRELLEKAVKIHPLWEEFGKTGEESNLYLFDKIEERFMKITEEYSGKLINEFD